MVGGPITLGLFILLLVSFISMNFEVEQLLPIIRSGFVGGMFEEKKGVNTNVQCGVDLPSCQGDTRCMNGFCRHQDIPALKETGLKVVP
jgi:hypothetical protein